jgi:hypothetical protein
MNNDAMHMKHKGIRGLQEATPRFAYVLQINRLESSPQFSFIPSEKKLTYFFSRNITASYTFSKAQSTL